MSKMVKLHGWTVRAAFVGLIAFIVLFTSAFPGSTVDGSPLPAATAPSLGAAQSFAVLGGSTVTNTGATTVNGDLGVSPGSAVTGFPPGTVTGGTIHVADAVALQAQNSVVASYNSLASQACDGDLTGQDLGGKTLTPGVYCFSSSAGLTGALTLNAQGNSGATFVLKIGSTLTTASGSSVLMINSGSPCNVFWQVGSSATLGTNTTFVGSILALTSITLNTGAKISGRALARNGAVTMDTNNVSSAACAAATPTPAATAGPGSPTATLGTPTAIASPAAPTATAGGPTGRCIGNIRGSKIDGAGQRLAGWTIQLLQASQVVRTAVTDSNGNFDFLGLGMGAYTIREVLQTGWSAQGPTSIDATLTACDQNLTGFTFVNVLAAATPIPSTSATVTTTSTPVSTQRPPATIVETPVPAAPAVIPELAPTPTVVMPTTLPRTGGLNGLAIVWLALGGAGTALLGFSIRRRRRQHSRG